MEILPCSNRLPPVISLWSKRTSLYKIDGLLVDCNHTGAGTRLDRHVADGHATFHRKRFNRFTCKLDCIAGTTCGADLADHRQHNILSGDTTADGAVDAHQHALRLLLYQTLGRQYVLHLGGTDTEGERPQCTVGGGVGVTTDDGHPRQGGPLLRADHMDDALTDIAHLELGDAEVVGILVQSLHLGTGHRIGNPPVAVCGRHIVVGHRHIGIDSPWPPPCQFQPLKGLRRGHLVQQLAVDIEQCAAVLFRADHVRIPELVVKGLSSHDSIIECEIGKRGILLFGRSGVKALESGNPSF